MTEPRDLHQEAQLLYASISDKVRSEILSTSRSWGVYTSEQEAERALLESYGLAALCVPPITNRYSAQMWRAAISHWIDDPLTPWLVIYHVTQIAESRRHDDREQLRQSLALLGDKATEALCAMALSGNNQQSLLEALAHADANAGIGLFVEAIEAKQKGVREVAQAGLVQAGPSAVTSLLALLDKKKKATRLTAANILQQIGHNSALEALQDAFATEKNADVAAALQGAIDACNQQHTAWTTHDIPTLEAFLCETQPIELPDFLVLDALPPLRWASGERLSQRATLGWLSQLARETPALPNATARSFRAHIDLDTLGACGAFLCDCWQSNLAPQDAQWMRWQLSITATPEVLYQHYVHGFVHEYEYMSLVHHNTRLSALILSAAQPPRTQRKAWRLLREAIQEIPPAIRPSQQDIEAFQSEIAAQREIDSLGFDATGAKQESWGDACLLWQLQAQPFPTLGTLASSLQAALHALTWDDQSAVALTPALFRDLQSKQKEQDAALARYVPQLSRLMGQTNPPSPQAMRWSVVGWTELFSRHPIWRACSPALLFATEEGQVFRRDRDGQPIDRNGAPLTLDPHGFVALVDPAQLPHKEHLHWQAQLDLYRHTYEQECPPDLLTQQPDTDPLMELRGLLLEEPDEANWDKLCSLLDHWPDLDNLELALSYIEDHAHDHWGEQRRTAPEHWALSLLPPKHKQRQGLVLEAHTPLLVRACNHLNYQWIGLKTSDLKYASQTSQLSHIKHLSLYNVQLFRGIVKQTALLAPFPALAHLYISGLRLAPQELSELFATPWRKQLTSLSLRDCNIDQPMLLQMQGVGILDGLVSLDLRNNYFGLPGLQQLAAYPGLAHLKELTLDYRDLGDEGLLWFAQHNAFAQLEGLRIVPPWYHDELVGLEGVSALAASTLFPRLKRLSIRYSEAHNHDEYHERWLSTLLASQTLPALAIQSLRAENPSYCETKA